MQTTRRLIVLFASAALASGGVVPALAHTDAGGAANAATGAAASAAHPTKAQRKQARKEARARNKAEIKKLENEGYQPGNNDPSYPDNLQNAEKKAAQGASQ
jgi:hypothetical protein